MSDKTEGPHGPSPSEYDASIESVTKPVIATRGIVDAHRTLLRLLARCIADQWISDRQPKTESGPRGSYDKQRPS